MLRFAAAVNYIFTEYAVLDRFAKAADNGFQAVEFLFPYTFDKGVLIDALQGNGLELILQNLPSGDWEKGERGIACLPDRTGEFQDGVGLAIDYASALGCRMVNCIAGRRSDRFSEDSMRKTLVDNLQFAERELGKAGIRLMVEPLNAIDHPGLFLTNTRDTLSVLDEAGGNIGYQYDVYHMQRMEGHLAATIERYFDRIGYIQVGDNPTRHEPGTGEVNFDYLLPFIEGLGYAGWIGCEYKPAAGTEAGLGWIERFGHVRARRS